MKYVLIGLLKVYRLVISPLYGNVCRYYPTCSAYALRAVSVHGAVKGSWLAAQRLLSCHPWAAGGYEPVPGTPEHAEEMRERAAKAATCVHTSQHERPAWSSSELSPPAQIPPAQIPPALQRVT